MSIFRELGIRAGKDRLNEEVVYTIARSYVFLEQAISNFLYKYNLTPAKFNILLMAKHRGKDKDLPQNEVLRLLLVAILNITRMVDKFGKDSYVQRLVKKGDRRVNLIRIIDKGSALLDEIRLYFKTMIDNFTVSQFFDQEKLKMVNLLEKFKIEKVMLLK